MGEYLAQRIIDGRFTYNQVISKKPNLKEDVEIYLKQHDKGNLITA
ncbi:hypothetical protein [Clostridium ihumii]